MDADVIFVNGVELFFPHAPTITAVPCKGPREGNCVHAYVIGKVGRGWARMMPGWRIRI